MKFILCVLAACLCFSAVQSKNLIHLNTLLSAFSNREDAAPAAGPLKRPIRVDSNFSNSTTPNFSKYAKPVIVLDYEKHSENMMKRQDVEMDNICVAKQGYIGLVTGHVDLDRKCNHLY